MATIIEDYCSFETSKLLKEKGFNAELKMYWSMGMFDIPILHCCPQHLVDGGEEPMPIEIDNSGIECTSRSNPWKPEEFECIAPTLQIACKWLREVHKIHIQIWIMEGGGYWFDIEKILNAEYKHTGVYSTGLEDIYFETYEEATEAAINYCLEHLI